MSKKIIYNLIEFTKSMVDFISDGSEEGQKRLVGVFEQAQSKYQTAESMLRSVITYFTRYRGDAFTKTITDLKAFPDPIIRLQEFKKFVSLGGWESTSANTRLFTFLIRAIPGYENSEEKLSDQYIHEVLIPPLRTLIDKDIDSLIRQFALANEQAEQRKRELREMAAGQRKTAEGIVLFENDVEAAGFVQSHPDKQVFHLAAPSGSRSKWQLTWYDLTGKANLLVIKSELERTLESLKSAKLPQENSKLQFKIKMECARLVEEQLSRTQVLLNPASEQLRNLTSAYVLTKNPREYQLSWYDSLGDCKQLHLSNYPLLATWLAEKKQLTADDLPRLKTYLQHIWFRQEVDKVKHKNVGQVLQKNHGVTLISHNYLAKIPRFRLIVGTYFLTREPDPYTGRWVLYQKQKGEANLQVINTDSWESFHEVLANNNALSAEQLNSSVAEPYELCLKPKEFNAVTAEKNKLYMSITKVRSGEEEPKADVNEASAVPSVIITEELLQYIVIDPSGKPRVDTINKKELKHDFTEPLTSEQLAFLQADILAIVAKRGHILSIADRVRQEISRAIHISAKSQGCVAVKDFVPQPNQATSYRPDSFVVTKVETKWLVYYIDTLQKPVAVKAANVEGLTQLFVQWKEEPEELNQTKLAELAKLIGKYKPSERIDMNRFSELAACIGAKSSTSKSKVAETAESTKPNESVSPRPSSSATQPLQQQEPRKKLNVNNYGIATLFGHQGSAKAPKIESVIQEMAVDQKSDDGQQRSSIVI
ncbi:hypothetical protein BN59_03095 [Legionella massiliensis]|uniref:Uncharacterized protein n=1 Tax=Legionella massiliensis TaxID=1034943 RepID=A0A078L0T7_9GAMM|nr:hypothetical protein [Legionella massiliensis]CDZ78781.1 hypothetical protein BN59_03095 [Legionella massiliensis]CEE14519.1 hypothetical protein BN1094_03095 [Legionella massiliensis]